MKVLTCQYYGKCFYGCLVWLNGTNGFMDLRKLNALHYRALRVAKNNFKKKISRADLDVLGRARPSVWAQYLLASSAIKAITRGNPPTLAMECKRNMFCERRGSDKPRFYDDSRRKVGKQAVRSRLNFMNDLPFDWLAGQSNDNIRRQLKKHFGFGFSS